jgi:uncharacterized protein (TIGR00162 family)
MKNSFIKYVDKPLLKNPIVIVGLPGVGNIGKICAAHLINHLATKKLGTLYSPHFPYHIVVSGKGVLRLLNNELFYHLSERGDRDLIIITGDYQSQTIFGQYEIAGLIINCCKELEVSGIVTIGGFAVGKTKDQPSIFGIINHESLSSWIEQLNVEYCEEGSPIVGAAGLLIGLAKLHGIDGICLLGETPGFFADINAAKSILERIKSFLDLEVDLSNLEETAAEFKGKIEKIQKLEREAGSIKKILEKIAPNDNDLSYFG